MTDDRDAMVCAEVPHRRLRLNLDIEADSLPELADALIRIATDLEWDGREERETTSGSVTTGHFLRLTCNPDQTPEKFQAELLEWRKANA